MEFDLTGFEREIFSSPCSNDKSFLSARNSLHARDLELFLIFSIDGDFRSS